MVQLHNLQPKKRWQTKKRVGRGGKRGTYSGRGIKGQKSRAGRKIRPQLRDVIKKIPKKRGYRFASFQQKPAVVNLSRLENKFKDGSKITPQTLLKAGLVKKVKGKIPAVKLLASGVVSKKLLVSQCQISKSAKQKIEKAGGKVLEK